MDDSSLPGLQFQCLWLFVYSLSTFWNLEFEIWRFAYHPHPSVFPLLRQAQHDRGKTISPKINLHQEIYPVLQMPDY